MKQNSPYQKILLLATNHVGNNLFCTPAIRLLKKHLPDTQLDVVAQSARGVAAFVGNSDINKIHKLYRKKTLQKLARNYDLVIGLHHDKAKEYLTGLTVKTIALGPPCENKHRADEILEFIRDFLGCTITHEDRHYVLFPQPENFLELEKYLKTSAQDLLIGLHLGTGRTSVHGWKFWYKGRNKDPRLWSLEHYIVLAKLLIASNPKIRLVITGSPNENFLGKQFVKALPTTINLMGKTSLLGLTALMRHLQVFVSQDTGALHVASATEVNLVGLFGPSNPERAGPYPLLPRHAVIKKATMAEITPQEVCDVVLAKVV